MRKVCVAVEFDLDLLESYTDSDLAALHHVCQANPAEYGDDEVCRAAEAVKFEIVRRWLKSAPVELYNHQGRHARDEQIDRLIRWYGAADKPVEGLADA